MPTPIRLRRFGSRRSRVGVVLAALLAVPAAGLPATTATAGGEAPPAQSKSTDPQSVDNINPKILAEMRRQEALQPVVQAIGDEQMKTPQSGFAGLAFEGNGVSLYWKGALTPGMEATVAQARKTGPVTVKPAAYSETELHAEGKKIHDKVKSHDISDIQSVIYKPDGSGLEVKRAPADHMAKVESGRAKHGKPAPAKAEQILAEAGVSVPTALSTETQTITPLSSRIDDWSPWNGGSYWESNRNGLIRAACTTGFGVHSGGYSYVLSAAHCATAPDNAYQGQGAASEYMGLIATDDYAYDILLINASGWYLIFDGGPTTTNTKKVNSWGGWISGELVCQSGSTSGTVCGLRQEYSYDFTMTKSAPDSDGDWGYTVYGLILTTQVDGRTAAQHGDSGGPVFTLDGAGVRAKGLLSNGVGTNMSFQDWATIINRTGAYPNTNSATS